MGGGRRGRAAGDAALQPVPTEQEGERATSDEAEDEARRTAHDDWHGAGGGGEGSDSDDGTPGMLSDYLVSSDDDGPDDDVEPTQGGARRAARRMPSSVYEAVRHTEQRCTEETGSRPRASGAPPVVDPVASLGMTVSEDLRRLRRRLIEYLEEEAVAGRSVMMQRGQGGGLHAVRRSAISHTRPGARRRWRLWRLWSRRR